MNPVYDLCGYEKSTGTLAVEHPVAARFLPLVRTLVVAKPDDPELILPYELSENAVATLAEALGLSIDLRGFRFWFEASDASEAEAGTRIVATAP